MSEEAEDGGVAEELKEADRLAASVPAPTASSFASHNEQPRAVDSLALSGFSLFSIDASPASTPTDLLSSSPSAPNFVQFQWDLRPSSPSVSKPRSRRLPRTRLPSLAPFAYHLRTSAALPITDSTALTVAPSIVASASTLSSALSIALTSSLSPSLAASIALNLSTPSPLSLSLIHSSATSSSLIRLTGQPQSLRLGGQWRRNIGAGAVVLESEGTGLWACAWEWDRRADGQADSRVAVRRMRGVVECSTRLSRPLPRCPPFHRLYLHAAVALPASRLLAPSARAALPSPSYVDLRQQPGVPAAPPQALDSPSSLPLLSAARLSVEVGVSANVNRLHRLDVGVGCSSRGVYVHLALSSPTSTWSLPLFVAPPSTVGGSPLLLSSFTLAVAVPVTSVFLYALLVAPLYRLYQRKCSPPADDSAASLAAVYRQVMRPVAEMRAIASPSLALVAAHYGWAYASSTRSLRPSHPVFRWGGEGEAGEVEWLQASEVGDVVRFWLKDGRLVVGEGRKRRMLGMEAIQRPVEAPRPLVLGLYLRYASEGVTRHVFVGEREGCVLPSPEHRLCRQRA